MVVSLEYEQKIQKKIFLRTDDCTAGIVGFG
jgi:hypothetical protein